MQLCGRAFKLSVCCLTIDDPLGFRLFVRWYLCLDPQVLSARNISVADSYCNVFYFVLFFALVCLYVRGLACCFVRFFVSSLVCSVVISVMLALV